MGLQERLIICKGINGKGIILDDLKRSPLFEIILYLAQTESEKIVKFIKSRDGKKIQLENFVKLQQEFPEIFDFVYNGIHPEYMECYFMENIDTTHKIIATTLIPLINRSGIESKNLAMGILLILLAQNYDGGIIEVPFLKYLGFCSQEEQKKLYIEMLEVLKEELGISFKKLKEYLTYLYFQGISGSKQYQECRQKLIKDSFSYKAQDVVSSFSLLIEGIPNAYGELSKSLESGIKFYKSVESLSKQKNSPSIFVKKMARLWYEAGIEYKFSKILVPMLI